MRGDHKPVLGVKDILKMDLISVNIDNFERVLNVRSAESRQTPEMMADLISRYPEVFADTVGTLAGEAHLSVDSSISPVILPARSLPISLRPKVKAELKRLLKLAVISQVDEPTSWVSQIVVFEKRNLTRYGSVSTLDS